VSVESVLKRSGPRKLLALDGGGIRGLITIEVLAELERQIREGLIRQGKLGAEAPFVLADYFDYIAGTSTGAIIATALSTGMSIDKIRSFYETSGEAMFEPAGLLRRTFVNKFEDKALAAMLQDTFGATTTLGDGSLRTLLMLVLRNVTTDSPWPLSNNPHAKYNDRKRSDCNLHLPLWKLIRASTAAPTFFPPEQVTVGDQEFIFVDGGITPYNNPAFQLFLMATAQPYYLNWKTGEEKMLLISVGTGLTPQVQPNLKPGDMHKLYQAQSLPLALMFAAQNEQDLLCRIFGRCLAGDEIDSEVGNLIGAIGPADPKLFTYVRYDAELSAEGLKNLGVGHLDPVSLQAMDSVQYMKELQEVGKAIASQKVDLSKSSWLAFL
jgi:patatin-like phospholipase/acyl hydrolase